MKKAVLIVGLPGSGKTHLAKNKYVPMGYILCDDPISLDACLFDNGFDLVFTDPHLCNENTRMYAERNLTQYGYKIEWVFFENNEEKCKILLKLRNDDRIITSFTSFKYTIPKNVVPLEIYQPKENI